MPTRQPHDSPPPVPTGQPTLSSAEAGLLASSNFLGYLVGALAASLAAFPRQRLVLLNALALSGITTAMTAP